MSLKTVLVSQRLIENDTYPETREALDVRMGEFLHKCGLIPVPVSLHIPVGDYFEQFNPAGVFLPGGNDLEICAPGNTLSRQRDELETQLIEKCLELELPLMGICRGMQMLAHFLSGKLEKMEGHVGTKFSLELANGSLLNSYYGDVVEANCYQQYCVTEINDQVVNIVATNPKDGVVEAFEHKHKPILGLSWHPERFDEFREKEMNLVSDFFYRRNQCQHYQKI